MVSNEWSVLFEDYNFFFFFTFALNGIIDDNLTKEVICHVPKV